MQGASGAGKGAGRLVPEPGWEPVVPPDPSRKAPWEYGRAGHAKRNEVERLFRRLKGFRRLFPRFGKPDVMSTGFPLFVLTTSGPSDSVNSPLRPFSDFRAVTSWWDRWFGVRQGRGAPSRLFPLFPMHARKTGWTQEYLFFFPGGRGKAPFCCIAPLAPQGQRGRVEGRKSPMIRSIRHQSKSVPVPPSRTIWKNRWIWPGRTRLDDNSGSVDSA